LSTLLLHNFASSSYREFKLLVCLTRFLISSLEGVSYEDIDAKDPDMLTEVEKVALLGRPRLGDVTKVQIRIKESKEFKVGLAMPVDYSSRVLRMDFFSRDPWTE
jgi:hypothetical protein